MADSKTAGEQELRMPKLHVAPNVPIGKAKGAVPGRVAWIHAPGVAKWDGETGIWVEDRWNDQQIADAMVREMVAVTGGAKECPKGLGSHDTRLQQSSWQRR